MTETIVAERADGEGMLTYLFNLRDDQRETRSAVDHPELSRVSTQF